MGRYIPLSHLYKIDQGSNKTLTLDTSQTTHPGYLILDAAGIPLNFNADHQISTNGREVYLMHIPHLDTITKMEDGTVEIRLGHRGGEHATATNSVEEHMDSAAYIRVKFWSLSDWDVPRNSVTYNNDNRPEQHPFTNFRAPFADQDAYDLTSAAIGRLDESTPMEFGPEADKYLVVTPSSGERATITILADPGTGSGQPEINCDVAIIGRGPGVACILDPASCPQVGATGVNGHYTIIYGPGHSFTFSGGDQGYWIAPMIKPHGDDDGAVVFEVGDPEPNAKIIIDDA